MKNWENNIRKVVPYVPGEQPKNTNVIKLNTNENPYPPAPGVKKALESFDTDRLRLYPDPLVGDLVQAIAEVFQVQKDQVFVGVGSDDVLAMLFMTFFNSDQPILFPDITYSFYDVWADMLRIPYEQIPLDDSFRIRPADYVRPNGGIVFPNPNAPTGELLELSEIEKIIAANPDVIVIVDEAYIDFGGVSALPLIEKYDNVIIVQTFSKSRSMAGSRIGFAISNPTLIKYLNDVKYSFNSYTMDALTIALGTAAVKDTAYFEETREKIIKTREWTKEQLRELGFVFGDSKSNFIFAKHPKVSGEQLFEELKKHHIYVRHFSKPARINEYLRITVGTDEQMKTLLDLLREILPK
ncbi:MAG: histidinol-phosphate transaminase [Lachnospiraceae bacterium]|nr:histidinol-phosphate transaminase [Lachnospiraceae bacterium]